MHNTDYNYKVSRSSFGTLRPEQELNDEIVNAYFKLIQGHKNVARKVYIFDTYFYTTMVKNLEEKKEYFRFLTRINLLEYDLLLCPINKCKHWTLIAVDVPNRTIKFYDSLSNPERGQVEINDIRKMLDYNCGSNHHTRLDWTIDRPKIPQQDNSTDCGVFLCQNARELAQGHQQFEFTQQHAEQVRREMVFEIGSGALLAHWKTMTEELLTELLGG